MKQIIFLVGCAGLLAGCNKGPQVNLKNATGNQVAQAVTQSGVLASDTMIDPGEWQSKVTVQEMNIPGMPAQFAAKMKQSMAEHQQETSKHCLTKEDVKQPKEGFFAGDKSCHYAHFTMGGGKIDIQMVCHEQEGVAETTNMSGSYTPTSYSMDMSSSAAGGPQSGMTMKMHVDAQRVGECSSKE